MNQSELAVLDMTIDNFRRYVNTFEEVVNNFQRQIDRLVQIEGMKAENAQRQHLGQSMAYTEQHFNGV